MIKQRLITSIKVPARFTIGAEGERTDVAHFTLGPGPCGKDVLVLVVEYDAAGITIAQGHTDGTVAVFIYPMASLTGRVEVTYG